MSSQSPPENICVVRLSAIGDTCHVLAVVRTIQDTWPETKITWVIGKTEASLLGDIPDIEFIIFDKSAGLSEYLKIRSKLARRRFDYALCMHPSMRANFILPFINTHCKIGFDRARAKDQQWLFANKSIESRGPQHILDSLYQFAEAIGVERRTPRWDIPLSAAHRQFAAGYEANNKPMLLISPCSSARAGSFRNWSAENYAAAANHAQQKFDCNIVLTGGSSQEELEYGDTITSLCGPALHNLIGKTNLKQLLALIDRAAVVLCPDSGPAHMATATATPVISLYAATNPERVAPYLSQDLTVNAYPQALEKFLGKSVEQVSFGQRVRDPAAMGLIRLAAVNQRIDQVLSVS
jgi:heptosyltransferase I